MKMVRHQAVAKGTSYGLDVSLIPLQEEAIVFIGNKKTLAAVGSVVDVIGAVRV